MERIHSSYLFDPDLNAGKMIFLSGPRQIGKTTFVLAQLERLGLEHLYFNWDDPYVRRQYTRNPHFLKTKIAAEKQIPLIAFDEIHKHKQWKDILKGLYDIHRDQAQFIVTGSARLDYSRQSGDSLIGRYFSYRMLPLGLSEAIKRETKVYFFDWTLVSEGAKRLENMMAVALLRSVSRWNELGLGDFDLRYVRNQQGQEVDFLIIKDQQPYLLFEVKESEITPTKAGTFFQKRLQIPYFQVVGNFDGAEAYPNRQYVIAAWRLLSLVG